MDLICIWNLAKASSEAILVFVDVIPHIGSLSATFQIQSNTQYQYKKLKLYFKNTKTNTGEQNKPQNSHRMRETSSVGGKKSMVERICGRNKFLDFLHIHGQECCGCCLLGRFAQRSSSTPSRASCVPPFYLTDLCRQSFVQCCTSTQHDVTVTSPHHHHHQDEQQFESSITDVEVAAATTPIGTTQETTRKHEIYTFLCYWVNVNFIDSIRCTAVAFNS